MATQAFNLKTISAFLTIYTCRLNGLKNDEIPARFSEFDYFFLRPTSENQDPENIRSIDLLFRKCVEEYLFSMQLKFLGQQKVNKLRYIEWPRNSRVKFKRMNRADIFLFFVIELIGLIQKQQNVECLVKFGKKSDVFTASNKFLESLLRVNNLVIKSLSATFNHEVDFLRKKHQRTRAWMGKEGFICARITLQGVIYLDYKIFDQILYRGKIVDRIEPSYYNCFPVPLTQQADNFFKSVIGAGMYKPGHIQVKVKIRKTHVPFLMLKTSFILQKDIR